MKITCLGAAGSEITGSAYLVQTGSAKVLVDCGSCGLTDVSPDVTGGHFVTLILA